MEIYDWDKGEKIQKNLLSKNPNYSRKSNRQ